MWPSRLCRHLLGRQSDFVRGVHLGTFYVHNTPETQIPILRYTPHRAVLPLLANRRACLGSSAQSSGTYLSRYGSASLTFSFPRQNKFCLQ